MADEAAGVRQDVGPGVPGREGVNLQVVFHRDRSPSRGKFFFFKSRVPFDRNDFLYIKFLISYRLFKDIWIGVYIYYMYMN